jgi:hypothetical protein
VSAESTTLAGRAAAEALMVDTCVISRRGTTGAFNETTGAYDVGASTEIYAGPCRVKPRDNADRVVQYGEQAVSFWPYIVSVPMSVTNVGLNDIVTITASELDPALFGLSLRVREVLVGTHLTARRLSCEENASA